MILIAAGLSWGCRSNNKSPAFPKSDAIVANDGANCATPFCVEAIYDRAPSGLPQRGLRVDATDVYWCETVVNPQTHVFVAAKVLAGPKDGRGPVRELGTWGDYQAGQSLVVDEAHAFWLASGKLTRVNKDGSGLTALAFPDPDKIDPGPLHDGGDAVFIASHGCSSIVRVPKDGTAPQLWKLSARPPTGGSTGLEVDGALVYCASGNYLTALDTRSGVATQLLQYPGRAGPLRKIGQDLYWTDTGTTDRKYPALLSLSPGAAAPTILGSAYGEAGSLMFDAPRMQLYWLTGLATGGNSAVAYDLRTREITRLASDLDVMGDNDMDESHLYWSAYNRVMRLRK